MGFAGGYTGDFIQSEVKKLGIEEMFTHIDGETRTSVNITNDKGASCEILEEGPEISEEEKNEFIKTYADRIGNYDVICVSGSLPKGLTGNFYKELVAIAKECNKKIIVDTGGKALSEILSGCPYMVKPNQDEISALMNMEIKTDEDIKKSLYYLREKGVEIPFISMGKDGAAALIDGCCYKFIVPVIEAVNTVGSGDSTIAGIAAGIDMGLCLENTIKLGMAAGIANTQFEQTGIVTKELVEGFYNSVEVKMI